MKRGSFGTTCRTSLICLGFAVAPILGCSFGPSPSPPRYDHIVIVVEENHSAAQVMGSPYLSSLAAQGASFSRMYGITHPSQPNYIALFSGSTQGISDNNQYDNIAAPNLATSLLAAGLTFATYSEGLPFAGDTTFASGRYVRRHNPCASFSNNSATINLPFFPDYPSADYSLLPTVSFIIPNLDNDMHDGTVAAGDAWLQLNLDGYAQWAKANNSLLIVTFDEPGGGDPVGSTPIATIFVGAGVKQTVSRQHVDLYSLLRLVEDIYDLPYLGEDAHRSPIVWVWQ